MNYLYIVVNNLHDITDNRTSDIFQAFLVLTCTEPKCNTVGYCYFAILGCAIQYCK